MFKNFTHKLASPGILHKLRDSSVHVSGVHVSGVHVSGVHVIICPFEQDLKIIYSYIYRNSDVNFKHTDGQKMLRGLPLATL
jgi:hypothetical protein